MASKTVKQESFVVLTAGERDRLIDGARDCSDALLLDCLDFLEHGETYSDDWDAVDSAESIAEQEAENFSSDEIEDGAADMFVAKITISTFKRVKVTSSGVKTTTVGDTGCN